jgi:hypothetical protein
MDNLLTFLIDKVEYDFCEDDDDVQGTWDIDRAGDRIRIAYCPFNDSPYPATWQEFVIERVA